MNKILIYTFFMLSLTCPAFAINWVDLVSFNGNHVELDTDSIKKYQNYYFYNIKFKTDHGKDIVVTMQAQSNHPFCARVNYYELDKYTNLNGDYNNITSNITNNLEPIDFNSRAYISYKRVNQILKSTATDKNSIKIVF